MAPTTSSLGTTFSLCPKAAGLGPWLCHFMLGLTGGGCPWAPAGSTSASARAERTQSPVARLTPPRGKLKLQVLLSICRVLSVQNALLGNHSSKTTAIRTRRDAGDSEVPDRPLDVRHPRAEEPLPGSREHDPRRDAFFSCNRW